MRIAEAQNRYRKLTLGSVEPAMGDRQIRIVLVDDHAVVRAGCRRLLEDVPNFQIVAEADNGEQAVRVCLETEPDVTIMDVGLPGISGIEATRRILQRRPASQIVIFSMHDDTVFVEQSLQAGARGYVSKSSAPGQLVDAVQQVAAGGVFLPADLAQEIALNKIRGGELPVTALSVREFEIFRLLASGKAPADIARQLSLSTKTVANYSTQIKNKLRVSSLAELTRVAIRHGFVEV